MSVLKIPCVVSMDVKPKQNTDFFDFVVVVVVPLPEITVNQTRSRSCAERMLISIHAVEYTGRVYTVR